MITDPIEIVTLPATGPVSLAELKSHLQLNRSDDDADLALFLAAAVEMWEFETQRPAILTGYRQRSRFISGFLYDTPIRLARGKVVAVSSVTYVSPAGSTVALTDYRADSASPIYCIHAPKAGWPQFDWSAIHPVTIDFTAGWANAAAVPADVKVAIRMLAAHWYAFRDAYQASFEMRETPEGFRRVANKYRLNVGIV